MDEESVRLIEQARHGDVEAFAELFEGMRSTVFSVACRLVGPVDADDVVMETYLKAWQAIPGFGMRSSLKTWLYRITHNCALDLIRSRKRRRDRTVAVDDPQDNPIDDMPDDRLTRPDEAMARSELAEQVADAISKLSHDHAVVLQLRYTDCLSYAEIAAATGVSMGTVMSRLFNAKRRLRAVMEQA